jgi:25S rRNA (adenine2142-N1)-methyltransferase
MSVIGFTSLKERWKEGGKMAYWLYHKISGTPSSCIALTRKLFTKKAVLKGGGGRNNFAILL